MPVGMIAIKNPAAITYFNLRRFNLLSRVKVGNPNAIKCAAEMISPYMISIGIKPSEGDPPSTIAVRVIMSEGVIMAARLAKNIMFCLTIKLRGL